MAKLQETVCNLQEKINERQGATAILSGENIPETPCQHTEGTRTKENLLKYLTRTTVSKTISGIFANKLRFGGNEEIKKIQDIAGVLPGVVSLFMPNDCSNTDQWKNFVDAVISNWNDGSLVNIHWHLWWESNGPLINMNIFTSFKDSIEKERKWTNLIQDGGPENKIWKTQLDTIAPYLKQIQDAGVFPIFDIFPYISSPGYIWRGRPGINGTALLYKITHEYLTKQHNLTSLIWSWTLRNIDLEQFEDFWPGDEYVDVASVFMWYKKELPEYQRLVKVVGNKPLSMEFLMSVPTQGVLADQPRWTWFTAKASVLDNADFNSNIKINTTFHSISIVNRGDIEFFKAI